MLDDLSQWASSMSTEVEFSSDIPSWLDTLFREEFFDPCLIHPGIKQNEKNIFCLDCCMSFCSNCSSTHFGHRVLQIRKYNDHRVVKTEDMEKLLVCTSVQSYMLNRAQVVFLKARSPNKKKENQTQLNKRKGKARKQEDPTSEKNCSSCPRSLKNEFDYCSITCMVKEVLRTEGSILGQLRECQFLPLPLNLEEADGEYLSSDLILRGPTTLGSIVNGTSKRIDSSKKKRKDKEEASPCSPVSLHRRKGIPKRSPLY